MVVFLVVSLIVSLVVLFVGYSFWYHGYSFPCCGYAPSGVKLNAQDIEKLHSIREKIKGLKCRGKITVINWRNSVKRETVFNFNGGLTEKSKKQFIIAQKFLNMVRRVFCRSQEIIGKMYPIDIDAVRPATNFYIARELEEAALQFVNEMEEIHSTKRKLRKLLVEKIQEVTNFIKTAHQIIDSYDTLQEILPHDFFVLIFELELVLNLDKDQFSSWISEILQKGYTDKHQLKPHDKMMVTKEWKNQQKNTKPYYFDFLIPGNYVPCWGINIDGTGFGLIIEIIDSAGNFHVYKYIPHDKKKWM